jgi:predicted pyridoxine 5'-phosphate oxidase superfamily flavin-nucleotide-binding protein
MPERFHVETFTPAVLAAQEHAYGRAYAVGAGAPDAVDPLGPDERAFIAARDSFYLASISANGWPYIQHRGGPRGFLRALDEHTLAFADLKGNRHLITTGNLAGDDHVALFLMDYPNRTRLKLLGHARTIDARDDPALADALGAPALRKRVERVIRIDVVAFDWNCSACITPRYTADEVEEVIGSRRGER